MTDAQAPAPTGDMQARCAEIVQWRRTGLYAGTALQALADTERYSHYGEYALRRAEDDTLFAAAEAFAAAPSPSTSTMGVKELVWIDTANDGTLWKAHTPFFAYAIEDQGANWTKGRFWLYLPERGLVRRFETLEAARAAAQADFTRRIQSCQSSAGGEGTVEALRVEVQKLLKMLDLVTQNMQRSGIVLWHENSPISNQIEAVRASLTSPKAETETALRPAGWSYEFHEFGDVWKRHIILNTPEAIGSAKPPTKHHGNEIRNVRPVYFDICAARLAETETASERERLVEVLRRIAETRWDAGALDAVLTLIQAEARAVLAQEVGR